MASASRGVFVRAWHRLKSLFAFWGEPIPTGSRRFRWVGYILKTTCLLTGLNLIGSLFLTAVLGLLVVVGLGLFVLAGAGVDFVGTGAFFLGIMGMFGLMFLFGALSSVAVGAVLLAVANRAYLSWIERDDQATARVRVVGLVLVVTAVVMGGPWVLMALARTANTAWYAVVAAVLPASVTLAAGVLLLVLAGGSRDRRSVRFEVV